jgi:hypothetical protein
MEALKKRSEKAYQVSSKMAQLKALPKLRFGAEAKPPAPEKPAQETPSPSKTIGKVRMIGHS